MNLDEFPLIISPNLGCPEIVSVAKLKKGQTIPLVVAGRFGEFVSPLKELFENSLSLQPSDGTPEEIPLFILEPPKELTAWNHLTEFPDLGSTREIISSELHYNVLGKKTRYWRINASVYDYNALVKRKGRKYPPRLFDLVLSDKSNKGKKINYHSIQFVNHFKKDFHFIHLTDLHIAKRNDEILSEVLKEPSKRPRKRIEESYINFNGNLRDFIGLANNMADAGELDFVVISGDLVDFAYHGWEDYKEVAENNWKRFINIITGRGNEGTWNNAGLRVAVFTSTGNHDWRLFPYDPKLGAYHDTFGLRKDELEHYGYQYFDSTKYPHDERAQRSKELSSYAFKKMNIRAFADKGKIRLAEFLQNKIAARIRWTLGGAGILGLGFGKHFLYAGLIVLMELLVWTAKLFMKKFIDLLVSNPLNAEAKALHYYFKHVCPYFDYAFQYGRHSFIVMDTGADVFVGRLLDGKNFKDLKRMSFKDNILGGSPDARAFDSEQAYYSWTQVVWLENVLACISQKPDERADVFIFLHAPPVNPEEHKGFAWNLLWERNREGVKWISKTEYNLTYGSINHYLSQFFHLCLGLREGELAREADAPALKKVDLVFSGHTHRNMEFRLEKEWIENGLRHDIRIYSDIYSQLLLDEENTDKWWEKHKPVIVQTGACGLRGKAAEDPPYFRKVRVDAEGRILEFTVMNLRGTVTF